MQMFITNIVTTKFDFEMTYLHNTPCTGDTF